MEFVLDAQILTRVKHILSKTNFNYIQEDNVFCVRSWGSRGRAIARIYSFPKVYQLALNVSPKYVIEVISEKFDKLSPQDKDRVLIHELMHIPKTFSGSLVPHNCFGKKRICGKTVEVIYKDFVQKSNEKY